MPSAFVRINGVLYKRATVALDRESLLDEWRHSDEYIRFLPTIADRYQSDEEFGRKLEDKFLMWVNEQVLIPMAKDLNWADEAAKVRRSASYDVVPNP